MFCLKIEFSSVYGVKVSIPCFLCNDISPGNLWRARSILSHEIIEKLSITEEKYSQDRHVSRTKIFSLFITHRQYFPNFFYSPQPSLMNDIKSLSLERRKKFLSQDEKLFRLDLSNPRLVRVCVYIHDDVIAVDLDAMNKRREEKLL